MPQREVEEWMTEEDKLDLQTRGELYPYLSTPWDKEENAAAAEEKMPDSYRHW